MNLQQAIATLVNAQTTAFEAVCEVATIAAVLDGWRGILWVYALAANDGGLSIVSTRQVPDFAAIGLIRLGRQIMITEEGAAELLKRFAGPNKSS